MLPVSVSLLGAAALLGAVLAVWFLQSEWHRAPHWAFAALHAVLASAGFVVLLITLTGPTHGAAMGVAKFRQMAAICLAVALLLGLLPLSARLRRRRLAQPGFVIGLHATAAIAGVVILLAYFALRA